LNPGRSGAPSVPFPHPPPGTDREFDKERQRVTNFYVCESEESARSFFTDALRERVTGLYGVAPAIEFVEIAELVDNAH
jgi:hypothetical protein